MISIARKIDALIDPLRAIAGRIGAPLWDLAARLFVANAFFKSGLTRYHDWVNGNFASQVSLFRDTTPVPGVPPEMAAYGALIGETTLPVLLAFGLFGRFAAAGLLVMTLVIEWTTENFAWGFKDHIIWAFLSAAILLRGPGTISLDYFLLRFLRK